MRQNDKTAAAFVSILIAVLCWATVPVFLRYLLTPPEHDGLGLDLWIVNAIRYSVGALFWLPLIILKHRSPQRKPNHMENSPLHQNVWLAAIIPSLINVVGQAGWGATPKFLPASITGFGVRVSFVVTVITGLILFPDERRLGRQPVFWAGVATAVSGTLMMSWETLREGESGSGTGFLILLITILFWGWYAISIKRFMGRFGSALSFGVISLYTTGGLVLCAALFGDASMFQIMGAKAWTVLLLSGMVGVTFAHVLYYSAIKRLGALIPAGMLVLTPFVTLLLSVAILKEKITILQLLGGSIIVAGCSALVIANSRMHRTTSIQQ